MDSAPETAYADPKAWKVDADASEATLSLMDRRGPRPLLRLTDFHGSFYLRPNGDLAGFALHLELPPEARSSWPGGQAAPSLFWESVNLRPSRERGLIGRGRLCLGRRETWSTVSGMCTRVPCRDSELPYLKIVLDTMFASLALRWPAEAARHFRPVTLQLFTEIRPRGGSAPRRSDAPQGPSA
ncbi:hypothetical protein Arub01_57810 [Actinomadura rubrobrunea]|uniref:Uncharacterized protein n=1 Tax=Actinomadura rubrobrunea TaxID=115335 RepID=A0A9W6Q339_9ACTN|nr:hypothetical protein [Actinomadura rubrobrunea]GLW67538.1 hypothetical protein Arub01_57810 [Actinomadura rubrobrunea]